MAEMKLFWQNDKHIVCNVNNDMQVKIPSFPYVLVNRSVLCNCRIEAENISFWNLWLHVKMQNLN